jgi:hypothetical protein
MPVCLPACSNRTMSDSLFLPCRNFERKWRCFKYVDGEVSGEKNTEGTNNMVFHVIGLTVTLNGEHVSLHAGVNKDTAQ